MHDYVMQEMARQRVKDLHREASVYRIARSARGRKRRSPGLSKRHRTTAQEAAAP